MVWLRVVGLAEGAQAIKATTRSAGSKLDSGAQIIACPSRAIANIQFGRCRRRVIFDPAARDRLDAAAATHERVPETK
jgi:hypothetical protein